MKVAALVSGGVDSSVALGQLLSASGMHAHEITAYYIKIWLADDLAFLGDCPWEDDLRFAREACARLGVRLSVLSLQDLYWDRVVTHSLAELRRGHTPSPDLLCNEYVKFAAFLDAIDANGEGCDAVCTGHYARVEGPAGARVLRKGVDPVKDQTYFLSRLHQHQLERCLFPLGGMTKQQVRQLAGQMNLPNQSRPDSQGICFLGKLKFDDFVRWQLGTHPGPIIDAATGERLGTHQGYWFHTIGQRRGLGLSGGPWYVVRKEPSTHAVYVCHGDRQAEHVHKRFVTAPPHWIAGRSPEQGGQAGALSVKIRHGPTTVRCSWQPLPAESNSASGLEVTLHKGEVGIAPGQYAVFYHGDICLGSALILGRGPRPSVCAPLTEGLRVGSGQ
jgi:tRNA-specific 2-thiouridylase